MLHPHWGRTGGGTGGQAAHRSRCGDRLGSPWWGSCDGQIVMAGAAELF